MQSSFEISQHYSYCNDSCRVCVSASVLTHASGACGFMVWIIGLTTERMACGTINQDAYQM